MNLSLFLIRNLWGSNAAGCWFEAGKLLCLAADLDAGIMRVAVVEADGTCAGGVHSTSILHQQLTSQLWQVGKQPTRRAFSLAPL
jgi:hypothetical protein